MTYEEFQQSDREYEAQLDHREELEREDIIDGILTGWLRSQRIARKAAQPAQPVAALLDATTTEEWEAA